MEDGIMAKLIYIQGDATQPQRQNPDAKVYLPHCVNSIGAWGSGFVLAINNRWGIGPRTLYKDWNKGMSSTEINDAYPTATVKVITQTRFFVGGVQQIALPDGFVLVNIQENNQTGDTMSEQNEENEQFQKIIAFVVEKHSKMFRKANGTHIRLPYVIHPLEAVKVAYNMGCREPYVLFGIAGHDLLEDTDTTVDEIRSLFGEDALDLILDLTNDKKEYHSKEMYMESFRKKEITSVFAKLVDRIVNVKDFMRSDFGYASIYFAQAKDVIDTWKDQQITAIGEMGQLIVSNINAELSLLDREFCVARDRSAYSQD